MTQKYQLKSSVDIIALSKTQSDHIKLLQPYFAFVVEVFHFIKSRL